MSIKFVRSAIGQNELVLPVGSHVEEASTLAEKIVDKHDNSIILQIACLTSVVRSVMDEFTARMGLDSEFFRRFVMDSNYLWLKANGLSTKTFDAAMADLHRASQTVAYLSQIPD